MTQVFLVSTNLTDNTATFAIDGARYEYFFLPSDDLRRVDYLAREISYLKALNFAKKKAVRTRKITSTGPSGEAVPLIKDQFTPPPTDTRKKRRKPCRKPASSASGASTMADATATRHR